jgi:hypothetical protein
LVVLGELRAVGAFVTHVVDLHRALPSIAALCAAGRALKCPVLSEKRPGKPWGQSARGMSVL